MGKKIATFWMTLKSKAVTVSIAGFKDEDVWPKESMSSLHFIEAEIQFHVDFVNRSRIPASSSLCGIKHEAAEYKIGIKKRPAVI